MKKLILLTFMLYASVYAADPVKIAPVPKSGVKDPVLVIKSPIAPYSYCKKTKGEEKLCVPQHLHPCICAKE